MNYRVLARRYRPKKFSDIVGQQHVVKTLLNAISSGRIAHAYLFCGARGVGKTSAARIFAKTLNCPNKKDAEPCCSCNICTGIAEGEDIDVIEMDAASNRGIDDIRNLRENVAFRPARSPFKIYIIDEVHMLTREAFNALLKTLEEPPDFVKFVFCTTEPERILPTILSRCQRFDFRRLSISDITKHLMHITTEEGFSISGDALSSVARYARGGLRDSISVLEQLFSFSEGEITLSDVQLVLGAVAPDKLADIVFACALAQPAEALKSLNTVLDAGRDTLETVDQLIGFLRDCMISLECSGDTELLDGVANPRDLNPEAFATLSVSRVMLMINYLFWARKLLKADSSGRIPLEIAILRMAHSAEIFEIPQLLKALTKTGVAILDAEKEGRIPALSDSVSKRFQHSKKEKHSGQADVSGTEPVEPSQTVAPKGRSRSDGEAETGGGQEDFRLASVQELWYSFLSGFTLNAIEAERLRNSLIKFRNNAFVLTAPGGFRPKTVEMLSGFGELVKEKLGVGLEIKLEEINDGIRTEDIYSDPVVEEVLDLFPGSTIDVYKALQGNQTEE